MRRTLPAILLALSPFLAEARELIDFRRLTDSVPWNESQNYRVTGIVQVTCASSAMSNLYAVASSDNVNYRGMLMSVLPGVKLKEGDVASIEGDVIIEGGNSVIHADRVVVSRNFRLPEAPLHRFPDFRRGKLHARRAAFIGWLDPSHISVAPDGSSTTFHVTIWKSQMVCRVPGRLDAAKLSDAPVRVTGVGFNRNDPATGAFIESVLEISSLGDVVSLREDGWKTWAFAVAVSFSALVLVLLLWMWAKVRRERMTNRVIAEDRRRIAAELHDTIEQHLATAKLYATGALRVPGLPPKAADAIRHVADVLVHAKVEVRDAVMDLRGTEGPGETLGGMLKKLAARVSSGGAVRVHVRVDGLDSPDRANVRRDIVAMVNEAVTNAIKHGKAKNIAVVFGDGRLRVLNDGEPFDHAKALGPETGHFGLSGMRERALRSGLALSFVSTGKWCGIEIHIKKDKQ